MTAEVKAPSLRRLLALQAHLGFQALQVAEDRSDSERAPLALEAGEAVFVGDASLDREFVPPLRVTDVVDRDVVVLAPEERSGRESLAAAKHVERCNLSLALGDDPMFDPDRLAAVRVRPAGDVASGEDARRGRLEIGVDHDAAIHPEAGRFGNPDARAHAKARHDEVGLDDGFV